MDFNGVKELMPPFWVKCAKLHEKIRQIALMFEA
jgi:hypothetical protein